METKRIDYLDICKGLLIILVVIGHAIEIKDPEYKSYLIKLIYSFHMPAFFIISGFLFNAEKWKRKGFKEFLINRVNKNLVPYFFFEYLFGFTSLIFFYGQNLNWKGRIMEVLYILKKSFSAKVNYVPSWFLITLFFASILVYWLESRDRKKIVSEIIVLTIITIIGRRFMIGMDDGFVRDLILFNIRITLSSVFMLIGLLWRRADFSKTDQRISIPVCLAITMALPFFVERESMYSFTFQYIMPYVLTGITGTCVIVAVSKCLRSRLLRYLGTESLIIMGTHDTITYLMLYRLPELFASKYAIPVYFIGVFVLEAILIPVMNRFVPFLIGKKEFPLLQALHSKQ